MRKFLTIIESIILALGVVISIQGTIMPLKYSWSYVPYLLIAFLGMAFIAVLIIFRKKKYTFIVGIAMIAIYFVVAVWGYYNCLLDGARLRRLDYYKDKEVVLYRDDGNDEWKKEYVWNGEAMYEGKKLTEIQEICKVKVDGEEKSIPFIYKLGDDKDRIYYQIYGGGPEGDFLVMERNNDK